MKKPYSFRLDPNLIEKIRDFGEKDNRKLTPMIENILITFVKENQEYGNSSNKVYKKRDFSAGKKVNGHD